MRILAGLMLPLLSAWPSHCGSTSASIDYGSIGALYPIAEPDIARQIRRRAEVAAKPEQLAMRRQKAQRQALTYMQNPPGIQLPPAMANRQRPVLLAKPQSQANNVAAPAWRGRMVFINADDAAQRRWLEQNILSRADGLRVVLVQGSPSVWRQRWQLPVYFDQHGRLSEYLGVVALPSVLRQHQGRLLLEEFVLPQ